MIRAIKESLSARSARYFIIVFAAALLCRLVMYVVLLNEVDAAGISNASSDVAAYVAAAEAVQADFDFMTEAVYVFGPGYPFFLACLKTVFGSDPRIIVLIQVLLSALGSVLLAVFAFKLTGDVRIAVIAGLLNACSLVSVSLANALLSETLFFVLVLSGFLVYLSALERENIWRSILAGVLFAAAALTRSVGQYLIVVVILITLLYNRPLHVGLGGVLRRRLRFLLPVAIIMFVVVGSWMYRNSLLYQSPYLAGSNPEGLTKLSLLIRADVEDKEFGDLLADVRADVALQEMQTGRGEQVYVELAAQLPKLLQEHPFTTIKVYLRNIIIYTNSDWGLIGLIFHEWADASVRMSLWLEARGLNFRVTLLFIVGLIILWRRRSYLLAVIILGIYGYFALGAGFTAGQGMRVFYPGQSAWTIAVAYTIVGLYELVVKNLPRSK